jgi:hypothetical protein
VTGGSGTCAAGVCECGKENEACCSTGTACTNAADVCGYTTTSTVRVCAKCGTAGGPCCPNNTCSSGGCCAYVYSSTTGQFGTFCTGAAATCGTSTASTCSGGACGTCGGPSQPCCYINTYYQCTSPNTFCSTQASTGTCQPCGGMGQPCCASYSFSTAGTSSTGTCNASLTCRYATTNYTCQP